MEVGEGARLYTYRYTVTTSMTSELRWAVMKAILMFHNCNGQSHKTVSTDHNFGRERIVETDSNRGPSAYQPNALPRGQIGSYKDTYYPMTFKCTQEFVSVTFHSYSALTNRPNITVSQVYML